MRSPSQWGIDLNISTAKQSSPDIYQLWCTTTSDIDDMYEYQKLQSTYSIENKNVISASARKRKQQGLEHFQLFPFKTPRWVDSAYQMSWDEEELVDLIAWLTLKTGTNVWKPLHTEACGGEDFLSIYPPLKLSFWPRWTSLPTRCCQMKYA